jgi:hypothetical protein
MRPPAPPSFQPVSLAMCRLYGFVPELPLGPRITPLILHSIARGMSAQTRSCRILPPDLRRPQIAHRDLGRAVPGLPHHLRQIRASLAGGRASPARREWPEKRAQPSSPASSAGPTRTRRQTALSDSWAAPGQPASLSWTNSGSAANGAFR